jgi:Domain of unknown function (DUF222)/HNH endonuclease
MFVEAGAKEEGAKDGRADAQRELDGAPTDWIEREIGELAAHIAAATCRRLELICEFDRRDAHDAWGFHSCGAWVAWRCSVDPRSAREHVRVARALEELPLVCERFRCGELSYSKVRAITRIATPEIEAELVEMARYATASQLERLVRGYRRAVSLESAEAAHRDRFLACEWEEDGSLRIRGRVGPEDGALFLKAIEAGRETIREREEAHNVASQGGSAEPGLDVGRKSRAVPASMRRALEARDGGRCRFPGCENRRWVDAHHIVHWARGGETKLDNLALLCSRHHRLVHEGGFGVSRTQARELLFRRPDGRPVRAVPSPTPGSCSQLRARNRGAGLRIVPDSAMALGRGEAYDRELAVWGLPARAGP